MFFAFLVSLFGFLIAFRIAREIVDRKLLSSNAMTKIGTAYFCVVMVALSLSTRARFTLWCAIFVPQLLVFVAIVAVMKKRARVFRERLREVLTAIHLKMKSGRSFRHSLDEVISESDAGLREKLSEIRSVVVFSQQTPSTTDAFVAEAIEEFSRVDRHPHAALRRLAVFREKLRIEDDFRRKSGQVLAQIRTQSLVMTGLYFAVAIFIGLRFGLVAHLKLFSISATLFVSGLAWLWLGGRRMKWKV